MKLQLFGCVLIAVIGLLAACAKNTPANPTVTKTVTSSHAPPVHRFDRIGLSTADIGDAFTTTIGVVSGIAEEANPILAPFGAAAGIIVIPIKIGIKHVVVEMGKTVPQANVMGNTVSALGTCSNAMVIAGAAGPAAVATGALCALIYNREAKRSYRETTGRNIDGSRVLQ